MWRTFSGIAPFLGAIFLTPYPLSDQYFKGSPPQRHLSAQKIVGLIYGIMMVHNPLDKSPKIMQHVQVSPQQMPNFGPQIIWGFFGIMVGFRSPKHP